MRSYKTEGIIIKRVNFGEADRVLTIYTKHYGKLRVIAKGVRRITSRRGGCLELFNLVTIFLAVGRNLDVVCEAELKESFPDIRKNLRKIAYAYFFGELVEGLCPERQENQRVFELFYQELKDLDKKEMIGEIKNIWMVRGIKDFTISLLKELGYLVKDQDYQNFDIQKYLENILQRKLKSERVLNIIS